MKSPRQDNEFSKRFNDALKYNELDTLSLSQLGIVFSVSRTTITRWRNKNILPSLRRTLMMKEFLHVDFEWLLLGRDSQSGLYVSLDEKLLLDRYRCLDFIGKNMLLRKLENLN